MYFLSLQLIDNQEYVFVKLTFSSGLIYEVLGNENPQPAI